MVSVMEIYFVRTANGFSRPYSLDEAKAYLSATQGEIITCVFDLSALEAGETSFSVVPLAQKLLQLVQTEQPRRT